jgi:hypothetical protein
MHAAGWVILALSFYNAVVLTAVLVRTANIQMSLRYLWEKAARLSALSDLWMEEKRKVTVDERDASRPS